MSDMIAQYRAVREAVGLIDRSDVGKLAIVGKDRYTWLQGMVSNDVRLLKQREGARPYAAHGSLQACILNATGHILTDVTLINRVHSPAVDADALASILGLPEPDFILLDLPRINLAKIAAQLDRFLITEEVEIVDVSDKLSCLSLQGAQAANWASDSGLEADFRRFDGHLVVAAADHTGNGGCDIYLTASKLSELLSAPWLGGRLIDLPHIAAEAQEVLRVEAGLPRYGQDMDEGVIAVEANLGPTHISLTKGCYLGQEIIARIDSRGHTNRALTGMVFAPDCLPRPGDKIYPDEGNQSTAGRETGRITSVVAAAPARGNRPIALGYVRHEHGQPGMRVRVGEAGLAAEIDALPFYRSTRVPLD